MPSASLQCETPLLQPLEMLSMIFSVVLCRQYGLRIALFLAPQMALMQLPIIGPLMYIPIQARRPF